MRIGIDIDEVVVEFVKSYLKLFCLKSGREVSFSDIFSANLWEPLGISKEESIDIIHELYRSEEVKHLEFVKDAKESLFKLSEQHQLFFITSRDISTKETTKFFFKKHFEGINFKIIYSGDFFKGKFKKSEICKRLGIHFMIEDNSDYAHDCACKGTNVLLFDKPWNKSCLVHDKILRVKDWNEILGVIK